jgi:hypothetical protein
MQFIVCYSLVRGEFVVGGRYQPIALHIVACDLYSELLAC